jgi:hypothetical protein
MPKTTFILCSLLCSALLCNAQDKGTYVVQTGSNIYTQIPANKIYLYPNFSPGKVFCKDEKEYGALLNYNTVSAEIEFLGENKDTATLIDKFNITLITIGADTFYYDNRFLKLLGGNDRWKYATENRFALIDKKGGFDRGLFYSKASSGGKLANWAQPMVLSESIVIARKQFYFIGDRFNRFWPVDKKTVLKLFPGHSSRIRTFLRRNNLELNSETGSLALLTFLNSLK